MYNQIPNDGVLSKRIRAKDSHHVTVQQLMKNVKYSK